jgi:DNA modification methylase
VLKAAAMEQNKIHFTDVFNYLNELQDNTIDLAVIDPPYNQSIDEWDRFSTEKEYFKFTYKWLDLVVDKIKDNGSLYLLGNALRLAFNDNVFYGLNHQAPMLTTNKELLASF